MKDLFTPPKTVGPLFSSEIVHRNENNPIFTADNVPYASSYAFNAGVARYQGKYLMAFRNDVIPSRKKLDFTCTGMAESQDGIHWKAWNKPLKIIYRGEELLWCNDARLTVLDDKLYLSFCFNSAHGERPGIAVWKGGNEFDTVFLGVPQQRNMVLCPEKINGLYWRLERPAVLYGGTCNIWAGFSSDLRYWGDQELMLGVEDVPFANVKIGAGPPPVRTPKGWLMFFHAVDDDPSREVVYPDGLKWKRRYTAGAALFDLQDPTRLIAMTKQPLLVPEAEYETGNMEKFWLENVVFPCGAILEDDDLLRLYYGAGDYSTCMATLSLNDLWEIMTPCSRIAERATVAFRPEDR